MQSTNNQFYEQSKMNKLNSSITLEYEHGVAREQPTPMVSKSMGPSLPASFNARLQPQESFTTKYYVGQIAPARRSLLDEIQERRWTLLKVSKKRMNDRSAPNFAIFSGASPKSTAARRSLLDELNAKKWRLNFIKSQDINDRSAPNLHLGFDSRPEMTADRQALFADIKGRRWNRLSSVSKKQRRDRSNANFALWTKQKSTISEKVTEEVKPMPKINKQRKLLFADINGKKWKKLRAVPKDELNDRSAPNLSMRGQDRSVATAVYSNQPHLHSDPNSAFPVSEYYARNHADEPASWQGDTVGKKMSSLGKGFAGWIKEELTEVKDALSLKRKNGDHISNAANQSAAIGTDFTAPGSSVTSGLKQQPIVDTRLDSRNLNDQTVKRTSENTIY